MRILGRYFAIGAALGSAFGLAALVVIWGWLSIHLGLLGFLVGWIPGGLVAVAIWLIMVVFWAPLLLVGGIAAILWLALIASADREDRGETWPAPPPPVERAPPEPEPPYVPPAERDQGDSLAPPPPPPPFPGADAPAPPENAPQTPPAAAPLTPPSSARPRAEPAPQRPQTDDLGSDAAAAGDTSHKRPH